MQKRVLITGAASGLGKALALRWAKAGADVCVADINPDRGGETVAEIQALGANSFYQHCDITSEADIALTKQAIQQQFGGVDLVVNNAGVATAGALHEEDIQQWEWVLNINVLGAVRVLQAFVPMMKEQGGGKVLNVASQAGITTVPLLASYAASKAAMVSFSETMRLELADDNIDVCVLCPGFFKTNLDESVRSGNPAMKSVVTKLLEKASITAAEVADFAFQSVQKNTFMILTHPDGRKANLIKRLLPGYYLNMMMKHTQKFRQSAGRRNKP